MKFDLKGFKKVSSDAHHTTLQHPNGHMIKIAHQPLSPKMRKDLDSLPAQEIKMAEGGKVPGGNGSPSIDSDKAKQMSDSSQESGWQPQKWVQNLKEGLGIEKPKPAPSQNYADGGDVNQDTPEKIAQDAAAQAPSEPAPQPAPAAPPVVVNVQAPQPIPNMPTPQPTPAAPPVQAQPAQQPPAVAPQQAPQQPPQGGYDPYGTQAYGQAYGKGLNEEKAGIFGEANAAAQQGQAEAKALSQAAAAQQQAKQTYQDHFNELDNERKAVQKDYSNGHIDPNHYLNSMGTGQKIATAIGLILGGAGAGVTGQNPAMDFLKMQINNDIEAQKADMNKKENLLSANFKQFGNLKDATDMTRVMQNDIVSNQIKQAAAQATSPMARAKALEAAGKLDMESAGVVSQLAMKKSLLSGMQSGHIDPAKVVNMVVPSDQRAAANKELTEAQGMVSAKDNLLASFDKLTELNTIGHSITSPLQTSRAVAAIRDPLIASLSKETAGRFTDSDAKMVGALFPAKGDSNEVIATKKAQLNKLISEKMHFPILETYGISPSNMGRYSQGGQNKIQESAPVVK
jgi:hypothetical protein